GGGVRRAADLRRAFGPARGEPGLRARRCGRDSPDPVLSAGGRGGRGDRREARAVAPPAARSARRCSSGPVRRRPGPLRMGGRRRGRHRRRAGAPRRASGARRLTGRARRRATHNWPSRQRIVCRAVGPRNNRIATALAVCGLVAAAIAAAGCGRAQTADLVKGKQLFAGKATCGSCHTLARANTQATATQPETGPPPAAKGGVLTIPADPTGALSFTAKKATAPAGTIKFEMPNKSPIQHNLAIKGPVTGAGPIVGSGGTSTFTATLKPGTYIFYCQVPGHQAAGMKGNLVVK